MPLAQAIENMHIHKYILYWQIKIIVWTKNFCYIKHTIKHSSFFLYCSCNSNRKSLSSWYLILSDRLTVTCSLVRSTAHSNSSLRNVTAGTSFPSVPSAITCPNFALNFFFAHFRGLLRPLPLLVFAFALSTFRLFGGHLDNLSVDSDVRYSFYVFGNGFEAFLKCIPIYQCAKDKVKFWLSLHI